jgi:hypothetical protein
MIESITRTSQGYRATIDGVEVFIPEAGGNRHYQMVLEAIADGQPVLDPPAPPPPTREQQEASRQAAYTAEADPLFFKWQAGEATKEEWEAKRQEIRDRFPYPEEATL